MPEPVENDSPEMSFRRGYQHGVIDVFRAIERLLDPASREILKDWIEKDIYGGDYDDPDRLRKRR